MKTLGFDSLKGHYLFRGFFYLTDFLALGQFSPQVLFYPMDFLLLGQFSSYGTFLLRGFFTLRNFLL